MILKIVNDKLDLVPINEGYTTTTEPQEVRISPANLEALERVYGARTDACRSHVINDIVREYIEKLETED